MLFIGLVYKKGKFSATEEAQLNAAIEQYRVVRSVKVVNTGLGFTDVLADAGARA